MSKPGKFIERALKGDVDDLAEIDDEIDAWHDSTAGSSLAVWLGMSDQEYAVFVEHPKALRIILLCRKYELNLSEYLDTINNSSVQLAARGAALTDIARIQAWLKSIGRL